MNFVIMLDTAVGSTIGSTNPGEAIISAALAATAAQSSAWQATVMASITLTVVLFMLAMMCWLAWKFGQLESNTNSIMTQLVAATQKLGIKEGRDEMAAEKSAEQVHDHATGKNKKEGQ